MRGFSSKVSKTYDRILLGWSSIRFLFADSIDRTLALDKVKKNVSVLETAKLRQS